MLDFAVEVTREEKYRSVDRVRHAAVLTGLRHRLAEEEPREGERGHCRAPEQHLAVVEEVRKWKLLLITAR